MLAPGQQLGPYAILAQIGEGGMGVVYRARDTRLGREVAIKVLPASFTRDADRLRRFEQEARTLAALNHPNLLALYDISEAEGAPCLVVELLEGETLRDRLQSAGALGPRKAIAFARQIADGLSAAHDKGMVHRDLKPENIFLCRDGRLKILDFGLAKLAQPESSADAATMVNTSLPGTIVGTAGYMSPEQVRGQVVDARSDLFALGAILYEMLSGSRAFHRDTGVETMTAILNAEPPEISGSGVHIPAALDRIVRRALEKEPAQRFQNARDFAFALAQAEEASGLASGVGFAASAPAARTSRAPRRNWLAAAGCIAAGLALGWGLAWTLRATPFDASLLGFRPFSFEPGGSGTAQWSPDGKSVAYGAAASPTAVVQVFVRLLGAPAPLQLTHYDYNAAGNPPNPQVIGWMGDNRRVVYVLPKAGTLWTVSTAGGEPEQVPLPSFKREFVSTLALAPGGRALALLYRTSPDQKDTIWYSDPLGSPLRQYSPDPFATQIVNNSPEMRFTPDGKHLLLYINRGVGGEEAWWMDYPPSASHPPRRVLQNLSIFGSTPNFSFLPDNHRLALSFTAQAGGSNQVWLADVNGGQPRALTQGVSDYASPEVSPDGTRMTVEQVGTDLDVVSLNLANAQVTKLIATARSESMPAWAAKAPVLAYVTDRNGTPEIWVHENGRNERPAVTGADFPDAATQLFMGPVPSPDGQRLIYGRIAHQQSGFSELRLWISALAGGAPVRLTDGSSGAFEIAGDWAPDGNRYVYLGAGNGNEAKLFVVNTSGAATPKLLAGGSNGIVPAWSPTGEWIQYCDTQRQVQLISPDGSQHKAAGVCDSTAYAFSADGKQLYGVRRERDRFLLYVRDLATGTDRVIGDVGDGNAPATDVNPGIRLSLAPDGKSVVFATKKTTDNLWLVDGLSKSH